MRPLAGDTLKDVRVLELSRCFGGAALCAQLLHRLGATVRVWERDDDAPDDLGATVDEGKTVVSSVDDVLGWADVVIADAGMSIPQAAADPAKLIVCTIAPFAASDAGTAWRGGELVVEAYSGLLSCTGYPDRLPVASGLPYGVHVSALYALGATLVALWRTRHGGPGQTIEVTEHDCLVALMGNFMPAYFLSGKAPQRIGNRHTIAAPWNLYPASDGSVVICTGTGGANWWSVVAGVIGRRDVETDERYDTEQKRVTNVDEVDAIVVGWTRMHPASEIVRRMTAAGIPASEIHDIDSLLADPHYRDLREVVVARPDGGLTCGMPFRMVAGSAPAKVRHYAAKPGSLPLAGIRVLEFGSRTSAPLAGRMLADFGAEVVKIEPFKGESLRKAGQSIGGSSYLYQINNTGKRSIVIDATTPEGQAVIADLAREADVFIQNMAPGSLDRIGLGYDSLSAVNPGLIYGSVSGFGVRSSHGKKKALDTVVQAAAGMMHMTGYPDHHPVKIGISAIDQAVAVTLFSAVLAGLHERERTGRGLLLDLAMADVGVWMTQSLWPAVARGEKPIRQGNRSPVACPHNLFEAGDGLVAIAVDSDEAWRSLGAVMGLDAGTITRFASADARLAAVEEIEALVAAWVAPRARADIAALLQARGIAAAPVRDLAEVVADPATIARRLVITVDHPIAGRLQTLGNPLRLSIDQPRVKAHAPLLGEHTERILRSWCGYDHNAIAGLLSRRVILSLDHGRAPAEAPALA